MFFILQPSFISPEPGKKLVKRERRGQLVGVSSSVTTPTTQQSQPDMTEVSILLV